MVVPHTKTFMTGSCETLGASVSLKAVGTFHVTLHHVLRNITPVQTRTASSAQHQHKRARMGGRGWQRGSTVDDGGMVERGRGGWMDDGGRGDGGMDDGGWEGWMNG